jgi:hypothetical protein
MNHAIRRCLLLGLGALLAACAAFSSPQAGMSRAEVLALWGYPTRVVQLPGGERLQYAFQGAGRNTVMVDLDAAGRVTQVRQVLTEQEFARIGTQGDWTRADIERELGPPNDVGAVASWNGPILTYRWRGGMVDQMFWVYLDPAGVVRRTQIGMDPRQFRNER